MQHHILSGFALMLLALIGFTACKGPQKARKSDVPPLNSIEITSSLPPRASKPDFRLLDARTSGDTLFLQVSYMAGKEEHRFKAYSTGKFMKTNPPQVNVTLIHEKDVLEGEASAKEEWILFDANAVRYDGSNKVRINLNDRTKTVEYSWNEE